MSCYYYKITSKLQYEDCMKTLERKGHLWVSGATPTTHLEYFREWGNLYIRVPEDASGVGMSFGSDLPEGKTSKPWIISSVKKPSIFRSGIKGNR